MAADEVRVSPSGGLPVAQMVHHLRHRVRIQFQGRQRRYVEYDRIITSLEEHLPHVAVRCSPVSGSIVVSGPATSSEKLGAVAEKVGLVRVQAPLPASPLAVQISQPVGKLSAFLERTTRGNVDLPGMVFLSALLLGLYELARGNFRTPPWYTAFWYAFGVYSKSLMDRRTETDKAS
jgi:hypothetical protein